MERLGPIDLLLLSDRFFSPELADQVQHADVTAEPAVILPQITVEVQNAGRRTNGVFVSAWTENGLPELATIANDEIVINRALANELGVGVGDQLIIRLPEFNQVPADSPLGRKDDRVRSRGGLRVREILEPVGLGRFSLALNQQDVPNAFVALSVLQRTMGVGDSVNAIVFTRKSPQSTPEADRLLAEQLTRQLKPSLNDFGVVASVESGTYDDPVSGTERLAWRYLQFTTDRMIFDDVAADAIAGSLPSGAKVGRVLTYLANSLQIEGSDGEIPYSTVSAVDDRLASELWPDVSLDKNGILLNSWAAEDLGAKVGDRIQLDYFDPETTHGNAVEKSEYFTVQGIVPVVQPERPFSRRSAASFSEPPTVANDPGLTPMVEGVTDQDSIDDWDPPFPFDQRRVQAEDDAYWEYYRTTPKAFVSMKAGRRMWGSRFGATTSIRIPWTDESPDDVERAALEGLQNVQENLGFVVRPLRADSLAAASGTTPFEGCSSDSLLFDCRRVDVDCDLGAVDDPIAITRYRDPCGQRLAGQSATKANWR